MDEPDQEPTEKPTETSREAKQEGEWMTRNWIAIASISILSLVGIIFLTMVFTGLVDVPVPGVGDGAAQWITAAVVVIAVATVAAWGWRSVAASPGK
ncbi:hypothetical protein [Halovivax sp.]|uniref:hypothetical protein n=1 Tax=Halovivax sp. TaxID=1935978 RepID=UPI0025BD27BD|nr:hypothetical protein [Halovivax sp.]